MSNPWFRLYSKIITDPIVEFLSFEDQRHFVWLLCLKNEGVLDKEYPKEGMLDKVVARKLGLQGESFEGFKERIMESGLVDEKWQPRNWDKLQFTKRGQSDLPDGETLDGWKGYVYFIDSETSDTVKIGYSKNPWSRRRDLQTGRDDKLRVVATVRTTEASEIRIHDVLAEHRVEGEWFAKNKTILNIISYLENKKQVSYDDLVNYCSSDAVTTVVATKDTDTDTETDTEKEILNRAFDVFYSAGLPKRGGKEKALAVFKKKAKGKDASEFADLLSRDISNRLAMNQFGFEKTHPTTYLNGERWNDDLPIANEAQPSAGSPYANQPQQTNSDRMRKERERIMAGVQ